MEEAIQQLWKKAVVANESLQSQILEVEKREVDLKKRIEFLNETCKSQKLEAEEKTKLVSELQVKVKHLESLLEDDENDENHVISSLLKQKKSMINDLMKLTKKDQKEKKAIANERVQYEKFINKLKNVIRENVEETSKARLLKIVVEFEEKRIIKHALTINKAWVKEKAKKRTINHGNKDEEDDVDQKQRKRQKNK